MKWRFLLLIAFPVFVAAQDSLEVDYPLFVHFDNDHSPEPIDSTFQHKGFYLWLDTSDPGMIEQHYLSHQLYVVNASDAAVYLSSIDGRLYIRAEAWIDNQWQPITSIMTSDCGNSYYSILVENDHYQRFDVPIFKGDLHTTMRYTLFNKGKAFASSNAVPASIHKEQLNSDKLSVNERLYRFVPEP